MLPARDNLDTYALRISHSNSNRPIVQTVQSAQCNASKTIGFLPPSLPLTYAQSPPKSSMPNAIQPAGHQEPSWIYCTATCFHPSTLWRGAIDRYSGGRSYTPNTAHTVLDYLSHRLQVKDLSNQSTYLRTV